MKNLVFIVLLVVAAIAGYSILNKPKENNANVATEASSQSMNDHTAQTQSNEDENNQQEGHIITPADMSQEAQDKMMEKIVSYQKCMLQRRPEYMQQNAKMTVMVDKTIQLCEPNLNELAAVLKENNVNESLRKKMVHTMRSKAARKLMSNVMKSMAAQESVTSGVAPGTAITPDESAAVSHP